MSTIHEKQIKYCAKIKEGSPSLMMITRAKGEWRLIHQRRVESLSVFKLYVQEEGSQLREYIPSDGGALSLLIKNEDKMILAWGEDRYDAFGFDSSKDIPLPSARMVICYAYASSIHLVIIAHRDASSISIVYALANKEPDSLSLCMKDLGLLIGDHGEKEGVTQDG